MVNMNQIREALSEMDFALDDLTEVNLDLQAAAEGNNELENIQMRLEQIIDRLDDLWRVIQDEVE
ncbi:MAG TPA: hypothetical protein PKU94_06455 [Candidatus Hydrothermia bacterium]|nr:hypothetical protein [Candidatus Hydrothermia bacterium]